MSKIIFRHDTELKIESQATSLRIWYVPVGTGSMAQTFFELKISSFTVKNGFRIRLPGILQMCDKKPAEAIAKEKRIDITFRPSLGDSSKLQSFIFRELAKEAHTWNVFRDVFNWIAKIKTWKCSVIRAWQNSLKSHEADLCIRKLCKHLRSSDVLANIPIKFLHSRCSISLIQTESNLLCIQVPSTLAPIYVEKSSFKQVTLPIDIRGKMPKLANFIVNYIKAAVLNWGTIDDATAWAKALNAFGDLISDVWKDHCDDPFWEIKPSRVTVTKELAGLPRGSGLFCTLKGKHRIFFGRSPVSHWIRHKLVDGSVEERYAIGGKQRVGYTYFLPTHESFITGVIHPGFKVCHSITPTHVLRYNKMGTFYWLEPIKETYPGDEFTFDYALRDVFANNR